MIEHPWYAIRVRPRYERVIATALAGKGYESFLPLYKTKSRWSDRIKVIELPLFTGYLFCRFNINKRLPLLVTPGVMQIVGFGNNFLPVDEAEILALQQVVLSGLQAEPSPYISVGRRVRIDRGSLAGVEGIVTDCKRGNCRLVVSITLLHRSVSVEVDETWVTPLEKDYSIGQRTSAFVSG